MSDLALLFITAVLMAAVLGAAVGWSCGRALAWLDQRELEELRAITRHRGQT